MQYKKYGDIPNECRLTAIQEGVYLECISDPTSLIYNIPVSLKLPHGTDEARFIEAVKTVMRRHKSMFVTFDAPNGEPKMFYHDDFKVEVAVKNVPDMEAELDCFVVPFDLERGPLYRFELCRTIEGLVFLFDIHHLIFDGTSLDNFTRQIASVYDGGTCPEEELTLFDVARSEAEFADSAKHELDLAYYENKFTDADIDQRPVSDVVTDGGFGEKEEGRFIISTEDRVSVHEVKEYAASHGVTENAVMMAAFAYAFAKLNGTKSSSFSTVYHGRRTPALSETTGMFVRTMPMYFDFTEDMNVSDFIKSVGDGFYETKHRDAVPFTELAEKFGVSASVTFVFHGDLFEGADMAGGKLIPELVATGECVCDIDVVVMKKGDHYELMPHFRRNIYTEDYIRALTDIFTQTAHSMLSVEKLSEVCLVSDKARADLDRFNRTEVPYDDKRTVVELFREQTRKTPDACCVACAGRRYTYRETDEITDRLARYLVSIGMKREKVVGVLIPRNEFMVLASLGVLKSGAAYMPLDPSYPPERLNLMMRDSGAVALIYDPSLSDVITDEFTGSRISTDEIMSLPDVTADLPTPGIHDLFVMLYTSGSTGVPKGVMFEHFNVMAMSDWVRKYFDFDESTKFGQYASYGFDAHSHDIYPAITSGAELHIITEDIRLDFLALKKYFNENGITNTTMTTQIGRQFASMSGLETLKCVTVGGEKLTPPEAKNGILIVNAYGPTEGTVVSSAFTVDRPYRDVPIGKPVDNLKGYVVDPAGRLLPPGGVGELWISGPHVTRGYLNRPEKTAEAYGENPFSDEVAYERVYRTGDIVRFMCDGNLQFIGRRDAQVKVRGFRIELTEIEEIIRRFEGINDATVAAFDDPSGGKFVAAYVVSDGEVDTDALADFIRSEKPPYMVPAVTVQIDAIPLTQNGKVNKKALPLPERKASDTTPPENATQQKLFDVIAGVIGHGSFGIDSDVYEAGLTSIGAVKLNVALAEAFDVPIRIADIKANPTVRHLEKFIVERAPAEEYELLDDYPITETQSGIFVECMASPDTTMYNIPLLMKLGDGVDTEKLVGAVKSAINAHPYVKTTLFTDKDGNVRAARRDGAEVTVNVIKCDALPGESKLVLPYKLLGEELYRIKIFDTPDGKYIYMDFHHIISDGTSEAILLRDIDRAYAGEKLSPETFSGFEAALEEKAVRESDRYAEAKEYWKNLLSGTDGTTMPKKEAESADGVGSVKVVSDEIACKIDEYCRRNGLTPNAFFNGAFSFVLSRFVGKDSVGYATVHNGRSDSRLTDSVTMLVHTVPVTAELDGEKRTVDFVRSMQDQLAESQSRDACSFAELSADYGVNADLIFIYQGDTFTFDRLCGEKAELIDVGLDAAKAPLSLNVYRKGDRYELVAEYRRDTYSKAFAEALADALISAAVSFTDSELIRNVTMTSVRSEEMYSVLNDSYTETENITVPEMFSRAAAQSPDEPAVTSDGKTITYRELDEMSDTMAHGLLKAGVKADSVVGIILERSCEIPLSQFAILKAGGAFLAILPSYPDDRIEYCLTDAESPCVITTEEIKASRPELFSVEKPYLTLTVEELLKGEDKSAPDTAVAPDSLAYCIYTSGSTGKPKGVMIEHRNFSNMVQTFTPVFRYFSENVPGAALASCSVSFDASVMEIFLPLCSGRHLYMTTEEEYHDPMAMKRLIIENNVRHMISTPAYLTSLAGMPEIAPVFGQLASIMVGAEAFPGALCEALRRNAPELQILNGYGPSECTVCCSFKELHSSRNITIGRSSGNVKHYVVDKYGNVLPPYASGELIICGAGVGRGYVKLPEKTAASFFVMNGMRAYHSGDFVRLNGDGEIDFCGRIDNQIKLRGFRVELDEIEKVMSSYPSVRQSKVIVRNNGSEDYLAGFFTANEKVDIDALTSHLKASLTYYMVPAVLMQLDEMPLTQNGKIDKNGFPEVQKSARKTAGRRAAKKSLEQRLCEIFAQVLGLEEVFADDSFFELGGTSLTASKVTMILMSDNIDVKYGDIFDNPTPESLAGFIEERDGTKRAVEKAEKLEDASKTREALKYNTVKYAPEVKREALGNVLLTGAVGFLGIHILDELLKLETGHIYCLVRRGSHETPEIRLKSMLFYYFGRSFDEEMNERITVIDADITDGDLYDVLRTVPFDTVINCAACVKHFADDDILERINVHGVENLISVCRRKDARMVQISTTSVPGIHTEESYEKGVKMHENELFVIDDMDNKYGISKYQAENRMFDAIEQGFKGKVIRVGNLMGRHSDGEFQANIETNMFLSGIRGFATMGKYPISHMTDPMRFSPIDCTARAVVLLAGTNDKFTAFNCDNRYGFDEMKLIDACNRCGVKIEAAPDEEYYAEYREKLGDARLNSRLNGLAAYDIQDAHAVETDNRFTTNILYRIGFSWPLVDDSYLDRAINSILTLDYFEFDEEDGE